MPLFDKVVHSFHWREFYLLMQAALKGTDKHIILSNWSHRFLFST